IAFTNAPSSRLDATNRDHNLVTTTRLADWSIDDLFQGTIEATEEAVLNALVAAETMTGRDGNTMYALPHDRLQDVMRRYGRLGQREQR
ncbi:MAG TPA: P1 family peptidase, partial [Thermomicrobiaceae bacterium]|nr:P1 family peptidase [Thermomicrobiaceae bacterium]